MVIGRGSSPGRERAAGASHIPTRLDWSPEGLLILHEVCPISAVADARARLPVRLPSSAARCHRGGKSFAGPLLRSAPFMACAGATAPMVGTLVGRLVVTRRRPMMVARAFDTTFLASAFIIMPAARESLESYLGNLPVSHWCRPRARHGH